MTDADLVRFETAQADVYDRVRQELRSGKKRSHWMWFIFPQLKGLGRSPASVHFAIENLDQAKRYLDNPVLGERLRECTRLILAHKDISALDIFGPPDDMKLRSSLTLFIEAAGKREDRDLFREALDVFFGGHADELTMELAGRT